MKLRPRRRRRLSIGSNVPLHGIPIRDQRRAQLHRRAVSQHEIALPQVLWQQVFVVVHYSTQRNRVFRRAVARNYHLFSSSSIRGFLPPQQFISRCIVRGVVEDITQEFLGVSWENFDSDDDGDGEDDDGENQGKSDDDESKGSWREC